MFLAKGKVVRVEKETALYFLSLFCFFLNLTGLRSQEACVSIRPASTGWGRKEGREECLKQRLLPSFLERMT